MVDGKKSFIYRQTQPRSSQQLKICRGIIHIIRHKNSRVVRLRESMCNKLHLKGLIIQILQGEHHFQAPYSQAVQVPQLPLLRLRLYRLYLRFKIPLKNSHSLHDLQQPAKHTIILGLVLLVWITANTSLSSIPLKVPNTRQSPATDTRHLRRPKARRDTHRSASQIYVL